MADVGRHSRYIVLLNETGVRGGLLADLVADGGYVSLLGMDDQGTTTGEANLPVKVEGSAVLLNADAAYGYRVPPGTDPAEVENHYAKFGTIFTGADGETYVTLEVGPSIPLDLNEPFSETTDRSLTPTDIPVIALPGSSLANNYTTTTTFQWSCWIENLGDRACDFVIQPRHNGAALGSPTTVTLSAGGQLATGNVTFPTPPSSGDTVDLEITSTNWQHVNRPDPWVLGSVQPTQILVFQLAPVAAGPSSFKDLSDTPGLFTGEAGNHVAVNGTEDGLEFVAPGTPDLKPAAFRHSGSINLQPTTPALVALDVTEVANANYSLVGGVITVVEAGTYQIAYGIPCAIDSTAGATRCTLQAYVEVNGTPHDMSYDRDYLREASQGGGLTSSFILALGAGDTLELYGDNLGANTDVSSVAGQSKLSIMKVG